jgi:hypothetical protein
LVSSTASVDAAMAARGLPGTERSGIDPKLHGAQGDSEQFRGLAGGQEVLRVKLLRRGSVHIYQFCHASGLTGA